MMMLYHDSDETRSLSRDEVRFDEVKCGEITIKNTPLLDGPAGMSCDVPKCVDEVWTCRMSKAEIQRRERRAPSDDDEPFIRRWWRAPACSVHQCRR